MATQRALTGVAHDIAHHVEGPYVHIYPSLVRLCKAAGVRSVAIDLLSDKPYPTTIEFDAHLDDELRRIREKVWSILESYQFSRGDVRAVHISVELRGLLLSTEPRRQVRATVTASGGKVYESTAGDADV